MSGGVADGVLDGVGGEGTLGLGVVSRTVARTRTEASSVGVGRTSGVSVAVVGAEGVAGFAWCRWPPREGDSVRVGAMSAGSVDPDVRAVSRTRGASAVCSSAEVLTTRAAPAPPTQRAASPTARRGRASVSNRGRRDRWRMVRGSWAAASPAESGPHSGQNARN